MITLYGGPTPNARKIAIALLEMGLEWRLEYIDILAGDQLTPEFLALNPNNKTPVIVDDEGPGGERFILWETGAILLYLAEKTGRFLPTDPVKRAICWQWLMFQVSGVGPMFGQEVHFTHYAKDRHEAGKTVSSIYKSVREAGFTPQQALEFYEAIDKNYNGSMTKKEYKNALRKVFGSKDGERIWNNMRKHGVQYVTGRF